MEKDLEIVAPLKAPRGLSVRYSQPRSHVEDAGFIAVIAFGGHVPDGSKGKAHCQYIALQSVQCLAQLQAICLIMDLRELDYRWGSSMLGVFDTLRRHFFYEWHDVGMDVPIKLLASDRSAGLYSLIPNEAVFFDSLDDAIASCQQDLKRWQAETGPV